MAKVNAQAKVAINYEVCVDFYIPLGAEYKADALEIGGLPQSWVLCADCYNGRKVAQELAVENFGER